jgi:hypothetical protein
MAGREARRDKITVILPPEPPELNLTSIIQGPGESGY